jgi:SecY interacting protein Syd
VSRDTGTLLDAFAERFIGAWLARHGSLPEAEHDPDWPSPCEQGEPDWHGFVHWRPVAQSSALDWSGLETALETPVHPALKAYYGRFWSGHLPARHAEGGLDLIQLWNPADFERLVENLLGHALARRRARLPLTLFFACTEDPELILCLRNDDGGVVLERPARPSGRTLAPDLATFLEQLEPDVGAGDAGDAGDAGRH